MNTAFTITALPKFIFGSGTLDRLPGVIKSFGDRVLIVTGEKSFIGSLAWARLQGQLQDAGIHFTLLAAPGEPSPAWVDHAVTAHKKTAFDVITGIGGGSALDAAKAIAGLLKPGNTVMDHLEGVGPERPYLGPAIPLICVPTTAGTGSEATKNAVLTRLGPDGFKKSFRDETLMARVALVDPDLLITCPQAHVAANGMDAFTQLLESLVSTRSNPMTEALAWSGLEHFVQGFWDMWQSAPQASDAPGKDNQRARDARAHMAYASYMSGVCLAQTGLGSVHGLAQPLGALFPIPHGVVCGTLVAEATAINIHALKTRAPGSSALTRYARVGQILVGGVSGNAALEALVRCLQDWTKRLSLPRLSTFDVSEADIQTIAAQSRASSSMRTNPVVLTDAEIADLIRRRL